jgi:predicted membrane protein
MNTSPVFFTNSSMILGSNGGAILFKFFYYLVCKSLIQKNNEAQKLILDRTVVNHPKQQTFDQSNSWISHTVVSGHTNTKMQMAPIP